MPDNLRPTKKQKELLDFIEKFIGEHGYSPSYREIMSGLEYTSVATVALHVNGLIKRGHLIKRDHSARSIELVNKNEPPKLATNQVKPNEEKWLIEKVEHFFILAEQSAAHPDSQTDQMYILIGALRVLGLEAAAHSFTGRLAKLKGTEKNT